jgi:hypothetical protein
MMQLQLQDKKKEDFEIQNEQFKEKQKMIHKLMLK